MPLQARFGWWDSLRAIMLGNAVPQEQLKIEGM